MRLITSLAAVALVAITTPAHAGEPDAVYTSAKTPAAIAACMDESFNGSTRVRVRAPGYVTVERLNGFRMAMVRWEIRATPNGSAVEFHDRIGVNSGRDKGEACL